MSAACLCKARHHNARILVVVDMLLLRCGFIALCMFWVVLGVLLGCFFCNVKNVFLIRTGKEEKQSQSYYYCLNT